jgi:ferritin-like metal-binding protein YciE
MKLESLNDLYLAELKDLYSAEDQIVSALPKIIGKVQSPGLRQALEKHLEETRGHVSRLEQVFEMSGQPAKKQKCKGMEGLLDEGDELIGKDATPAVRDAAIIAACQRVEHYEMAAYGTVRTYADQLGLNRASTMLQETLDEESAADEKLTLLAKQGINMQATRTA